MIKWNRQFHYPKSSRKIIDGKRHYILKEEKLPIHLRNTIVSIIKNKEIIWAI